MEQLTELPNSMRDQALQRFQLLRAHLEDGLPLRVVAEDAGITFRTAQRWVAQYHKHGLVGLVRRGRQDRGGRRAISPRIRSAIEGLALERPPLPLKSIYRQVGQLATVIEEPKPSYWMVCDVVRGLPAGLVTLAHEGGKVYSDTFDFYQQSDHSLGLGGLDDALADLNVEALCSALKLISSA